MSAIAFKHGTMNIHSIFNSAVQRLDHSGIGESRVTVEILLAAATGLSCAQLYARGTSDVSPENVAAFDAMMERAIRHEPVQYIVGKTQFMGLDFLVDRNVLIPRPETEMLVERVIALASGYSKGCTVLDIGTGSGNIAISIAHFVSHAKVTAVDVSVEAIAVAEKNARRLGVTGVHFQHCNVMLPFLPDKRFDIIVANPPYISGDEFKLLDRRVSHYEPRAALTDESDGYTFIRRILEDARGRLNSSGILFMELAYNQGAEVKRLALELGYDTAVLNKDYQGIDRVIEARYA